MREGIRNSGDAEAIKKDPDFKKAFKLAEKLSKTLKGCVLEYSPSKEKVDFNYIIKTALVLSMAELLTGICSTEEEALIHLVEIAEHTAQAISNAYKIGLRKSKDKND